MMLVPEETYVTGDEEERTVVAPEVIPPETTRACRVVPDSVVVPGVTVRADATVAGREAVDTTLVGLAADFTIGTEVRTAGED